MSHLFQISHEYGSNAKLVLLKLVKRVIMSTCSEWRMVNELKLASLKRGNVARNFTQGYVMFHAALDLNRSTFAVSVLSPSAKDRSIRTSLPSSDPCANESIIIIYRCNYLDKDGPTDRCDIVHKVKGVKREADGIVWPENNKGSGQKVLKLKHYEQEDLRTKNLVLFGSVWWGKTISKSITKLIYCVINKLCVFAEVNINQRLITFWYLTAVYKGDGEK